MAENMGAFQIVSMQMIRESIIRARLEADAGRKVEAAKRLDYYKGDHLTHLDNTLRAQFSHPERLRLQKSFSNLTRRIINEVSVVYKRSPSRCISDKAGARIEGPKAERFHKLYEAARADSVLKKVNRYTNLLNTVGVMAVWRNNRVELDILTPDILNIVQDAFDPTKASAVIIEQSYANTVALEGPGNPFGASKLFIAWTPDEHMVFDEQGRPRFELVNEAGANPYGMIPIVWFRDTYPDSYFWNEGTDDLINAQETLNVELTELNQLIKMQSFSIPVIIGDAPTEGVTVDPSNFISIPLGDATAGKGQPDFKFVSPSPKIAELLEAIKETVRRIADDWGLSMESFTLSGSPSSGVSLKISNIRLIERREDDVALYLDYEKELFSVMRAVHNAHSSPADKLPEDAEFSINFSELDFPEDPSKEDARWITHIGQNIRSRAQWLMSIDPDVKSEEDAIEKIKANMESNAATRSALPAGDEAGLMETLSGGRKGPKDAPEDEDGPEVTPEASDANKANGERAGVPPK